MNALKIFKIIILKLTIIFEYTVTNNTEFHRLIALNIEGMLKLMKVKY